MQYNYKKNPSEFGFKDFRKIKAHDAFAYLRIQDEFDEFAANGYRLPPPQQPDHPPRPRLRGVRRRVQRFLGELEQQEDFHTSKCRK